MRTTISLSALFFAVAVSLLPSEAHALGPLDIEIAAKAGVGTSPGGGGPNPLGFGIGARAGVQILGLYGGLALMNYFGESQSSALGTVGVSTSGKALLYGVEGGYGSKFGPLTVRAQVGVGNYGETIDVNVTNCPPNASCVIPSTGTRNSLYVEPGLMAMIALGTFLIGADANVLLLPSRTEASGSSSFDAAFTLHGQLGVKF
jgi:hypothetical protein